MVADATRDGFLRLLEFAVAALGQEGRARVPGIGGIAGIIDCPFCNLSKNPKIPMFEVYVLSRLFISAISVLSAASSKFLTSAKAALDTEDFSTNPKSLPSSESMIVYSPTEQGLEVNAVTKVGFDSPITYPIFNPKPPVNQFHYSDPKD